MHQTWKFTTWLHCFMQIVLQGSIHSDRPSWSVSWDKPSWERERTHTVYSLPAYVWVWSPTKVFEICHFLLHVQTILTISISKTSRSDGEVAKLIRNRGHRESIRQNTLSRGCSDSETWDWGEFLGHTGGGVVISCKTKTYFKMSENRTTSKNYNCAWSSCKGRDTKFKRLKHSSQSDLFVASLSLNFSGQPSKWHHLLKAL